VSKSKPNPTDDSWVLTNAVSVKRCVTCGHDKVRSRVSELLDACIRNKCPVSRRRIYELVGNENPDYKISFFAFGEHLRQCERAKWRSARYGE